MNGKETINNLTEWMRSTRSILAVMVTVLLFVIVIGFLALQRGLPDQVLALVSYTIGAVITAYFGKRDESSDKK